MGHYDKHTLYDVQTGAQERLECRNIFINSGISSKLKKQASTIILQITNLNREPGPKTMSKVEVDEWVMI